MIPSPIKSGRPGRAKRIRAALASLSREALYELLVEQALDDRSLGQRLLTRYGLADGDRAGYRRLVREALEQKVNRKGYRQVCRYLRKMEKLGEEARVGELVAEWREVYARRPALLDELGKAFGG